MASVWLILSLFLMTMMSLKTVKVLRMRILGREGGTCCCRSL